MAITYTQQFSCPAEEMNQVMAVRVSHGLASTNSASQRPKVEAKKPGIDVGKRMLCCSWPLDLRWQDAGGGVSLFQSTGTGWLVVKSRRVIQMHTFEYNTTWFRRVGLVGEVCVCETVTDCVYCVVLCVWTPGCFRGTLHTYLPYLLSTYPPPRHPGRKLQFAAGCSQQVLTFHGTRTRTRTR